MIAWLHYALLNFVSVGPIKLQLYCTVYSNVKIVKK